VLSVKPDTGTADRHPAATRSPPAALGDARGPPRVELHRAQHGDRSSSRATRSQRCQVLLRQALGARDETRRTWSGRGWFRSAGRLSLVWFAGTQCRFSSRRTACYAEVTQHAFNRVCPGGRHSTRQPVRSYPNICKPRAVRTTVVQLRHLPARLLPSDVHAGEWVSIRNRLDLVTEAPILLFAADSSRRAIRFHLKRSCPILSCDRQDPEVHVIRSLPPRATRSFMYAPGDTGI
jgi:hypothetical protein